MKLTIEHDIQVTEPVSGVHRIESNGEVLGYVLETGAVFVALRGPVYNTSVEVGQALTLDAAVRQLVV